MGLWEFMNPPLWAMLAAVIVASIPKLQELFFTEGTFINASVTRAVSQSGGVAVPLILVVLGANLANNASSTNTHASKVENKILFASLVSRMVLPFIFTAPVLALAAKYLSITILDDPIFLIVCFLLTGAPSALQLAQICQINQVYEDVITRVLFWSYVVVILPSTLVLVITAIEVVHWAV
jgi:predicted permease